MSIHSINPKTLSAYRKHRRLKQRELAEVSRISKKTISRIEGGKDKANSHTVNSLAKALDVSPEDLAKPFVEQEPNLESHGFQTIRVPFKENALVALKMTEECYGISIMDQLTMAPLLAALMAEGSLAWRQKKLDMVEASVKALWMSVSEANHMINEEGVSIMDRDIFGRQPLEYAWKVGFGNEDEISPFVKYLCHFVRETGSEFIKVLPDPEVGNQEFAEIETDYWMTCINLPETFVCFSINAAELDRLTGDNERARRALQWRYANIAGIPEELQGDDKQEERAAWLGDKIPQAKWDEHKAYRKDLLDSLQLDDKTREDENEN